MIIGNTRLLNQKNSNQILTQFTAPSKMKLMLYFNMPIF